MARRLSILLSMTLALSALSGPAFAKKKKKNANQGIMKTEIRSFDKVFKRVGTIDSDLRGTEKSMRVARKDLNGALALKKGTPLTDAISELHTRGKGKLDVVMDKGKVPKLKAQDGLPSNLMEAVDSVNALSGTLGGSLQTLQSAASQSEGLVKATADFPNMLKDEFKKDNNALATLFKLPAASKALQHNLALTKALPDRVGGVTASATDVLTAVSGAPVKSKSTAKGANAKQAGKKSKSK